MSRWGIVYRNVGARNFFFALPLLLATGGAHAQGITAGSLVERLSPDEQFAYLAGAVEGLAYARYKREGTATGGAACINHWFYEKDGTQEDIISAFEYFAEYTPAAVLAAMIAEDCGD